MERSFLPTSSTRSSFSWRRLARNMGPPAWFSRIHSRAKAPDWISPRISFMVRRVSSVMMRLPRVRSPYSAVSLME